MNKVNWRVNKNNDILIKNLIFEGALILIG